MICAYTASEQLSEVNLPTKKAKSTLFNYLLLCYHVKHIHMMGEFLQMEKVLVQIKNELNKRNEILLVHMNVQEKAECNASVELWIMDHPN